MHESPTLHAVLRAMATELDGLAFLTDNLGGARVVSTEQWQALDLISQHLAALGSFLHALLPELPECRPDLDEALATVRVGSLVRRLVGHAEDVSEASGNLEFFET